MTTVAFLLIISSACFHALWNMMAKKSRMSIAFYAAMSMASASMWIHTQFWTPVDVFALPWQYWLLVAGSVVGDLCLYCVGLVWAYRSMDMSSAYPMMRSLPLIFIALITALTGWGKPLGGVAVCGMFTVIAGCLMMPLNKFSDFKIKEYMSVKLLFVLMVAAGTTCYTIFDSQAQKVLRDAVALQEISKPVISMTFYSCRGIMLCSITTAAALLIRSEREMLCSFVRERNWYPPAAGALASLTYITVLIAMNYVTNVTYVQLFRQTGLIFGMAAGILILKERCTLPKICGVVLIITGLVMTVIKFN